MRVIKQSLILDRLESKDGNVMINHNNVIKDIVDALFDPATHF